MKRFFLKIWAEITALVTWLFSPISAIWRGRAVSDVSESATADVELQSSAYKTWLGRVQKVFLHTKYVTFGKSRKQVLRIGIYLPGILADCFFQGLHVVVFFSGRSEGVTYMTQMTGIEVYANCVHSIQIKSTSKVSALLTMNRLDDGDAYPTNVERIELRMEDESIAFLRQPNGFFTPAAEKAA